MNKTVILGLLLALGAGLIAIPSSADIPSPLAQYNSGIPIQEIQCRNSMTLIFSPSERPACVGQDTAIKLQERGWQILTRSVEITEQINPPEIQNVFGTTTVFVTPESIPISDISHVCDGWPQDLSVQYPNAVSLGQEFEFKVWYSHAGLSNSCDDTRIGIMVSDKMSVLNPNAVHVYTFTEESTGKVSHSWLEQFPHDGVTLEMHTFTVRYDELPDRYDLLTQVGKGLSWVYVYHYVSEDTIYLTFADPKGEATSRAEDLGHSTGLRSVPTSFEVLGQDLHDIMTPEAIAQSEFYTEHVDLEPVISMWTVRSDVSESPPPIDSFADYIANNIKTDDLRAWLENGGFSSEYIEELLSQYPDLADIVANFLIFLTSFEIVPQVYASSDVIVLGHLKHQDNSLIEGMTVCAFDRDFSNNPPTDVLLSIENEPACTVTPNTGFYSFQIPRVDPNGADDTDNTDLVLGAFVKNEHFKFIDSPILQTTASDIELAKFNYEGPINQTTALRADIIIDESTHIGKAIKIMNMMIGSRDYIKATYGYDMPSIRVYFDNTQQCNSSGYYPSTNRIELAATEDPSCNVVTSMHLSDTPKHEYYHFYQDELYTVKNMGQLPTYSSGRGFHNPTITLPAEQAWIEGTASAYVLLEKGTHTYTSSRASPYNYEDGYTISNEIRYDFAKGITSSGSVTQTLYDLIDNTSSERGTASNQVDNINRSPSDVNTVIDDELNNGETIVASTIIDFVSDWRDDESNLPNIDNVLSLNNIIIPKSSGEDIVILLETFDHIFSWRNTDPDGWESAIPDMGNQRSGQPSSNKVAKAEDCDPRCWFQLIHDIDLTEYRSANLSLHRYVDNNLAEGEYLKIDLSSDRGTTWTTIFTWNNTHGNDATWHKETYDLSSYLNSADLWIRFLGVTSGTDKDFMIDDLLITGILDTPPSISPISDITLIYTESDTVDVVATDADGDTITLTLVNHPSFVSLSGTTINITPNSTNADLSYDVTVQATANGKSDTEEFTITVTTSTPTCTPNLNLCQRVDPHDTTLCFDRCRSNGIIGDSCNGAGSCTCPAGQTVQNNRCTAQPTCTGNKVLVGGSCVCPSSLSHEYAGTCYAPMSCSGGKMQQGSSCVCPAGKIDQGGTCYTELNCSGGRVQVGNQCQCPSGQTFIGSSCQTIPTCSSNACMTLSTATNTCVSACSGSQTCDGAGNCMNPAPTCSSSMCERLNTSTNMCVSTCTATGQSCSSGTCACAAHHYVSGGSCTECGSAYANSDGVGSCTLLQCSGNTYAQGHKCKTLSCPSGWTLSGNVCYSNQLYQSGDSSCSMVSLRSACWRCPSGFSNVNGACSPN